MRRMNSGDLQTDRDGQMDALIRRITQSLQEIGRSCAQRMDGQEPARVLHDMFRQLDA